MQPINSRGRLPSANKHFFLECKYLQKIGAVVWIKRRFRDSYADRPDLQDIVDGICFCLKQFVYSGCDLSRFSTLLGRWTADMQEDLAKELGATIQPTRWQHPANYGMVKKALVAAGKG